MQEQQLYTRADLYAAVDMFIEYVEQHDHTYEAAKFAAVGEVVEGTQASVELYDAGEIKKLPAGEDVKREIITLQVTVDRLNTTIYEQSGELERLRAIEQRAKDVPEKTLSGPANRTAYWILTGKEQESL